MTKSEITRGAEIAFLEKAGWANAALTPLAGDASTRSYKRVQKNSERAVLMIAPPNAETATCPPDASENERRQLGYNALARLAGPNLYAFIEISNALRESGLSAPEIYAADAESGFALIEDLGDNLFLHAITAVDEGELYAGAIDVLLRLQTSPPQRPSGVEYAMLDYDPVALMEEANLFMEWYWPLIKSSPAPKNLQDEYDQVFSGLFTQLSPTHSIVLRDFHAENLLWMPQRQDVRRVGLIDFQDGLYGHAAYDLVSLLEDARRDVSPELTDAMIKRYCDRAGDNFDRPVFMRDYAILAAQRNVKILGVFARLSKRDNKPRYLDFLPRVEAHFRRDLAREELSPLRNFIAKHFPGLAP